MSKDKDRQDRASDKLLNDIAKADAEAHREELFRKTMQEKRN